MTERSGAAPQHRFLPAAGKGDTQAQTIDDCRRRLTHTLTMYIGIGRILVDRRKALNHAKIIPLAL